MTVGTIFNEEWRVDADFVFLAKYKKEGRSAHSRSPHLTDLESY